MATSRTVSFSLIKTLASLFFLLSLLIYNSGAIANKETHYLDNLISSGTWKGESYIKFGRVRINMSQNDLSDDERVEDNLDFDGTVSDSTFDFTGLLSVFDSITSTNEQAGTTGTTEERTPFMAASSLLNLAFSRNPRSVPLVMMEAELAESRPNQGDASTHRLNTLRYVFYRSGIIRVNQKKITPAILGELDARLRNLIQHAVNNNSTRSRSHGFETGVHFDALHNPNAIAQQIQDTNVANAYRLAVVLNALLHHRSQPSDSETVPDIESVLRQHPLPLLAQITAFTSLLSASRVPGCITPPDMSSLSDYMTTIYRQHLSHNRTPATRMPLIFFVGLISQDNNNNSSQTLNREVVNTLFNLPDDNIAPVGEGAAAATNVRENTYQFSPIEDKELRGVGTLLSQYLGSQPLLMSNPDAIRTAVQGIMTGLRGVNTLIPGSFSPDKCTGSRYYRCLAEDIATPPSDVDTQRLRALLREYFNTFRATLQQLVDGNSDSPNVQILREMLGIFIEIHNGQDEGASSRGGFKHRHLPHGGAGGSAGGGAGVNSAP